MTDVLRGIDVSVYQKPVDWKAVRAAGASFAAAKCSEGVGYVDPTWSTNWAGMADASLARLGYHYARPDLNNAAIAEADWFLHCLGTPHPSDIAALDIEVEAPSVDVAAWCQTWLQHVEQVLGFRPLIYTDLEYAQRHFAQTPSLAHWPLWLALYSDALPRSVPPWPEVTLWQRTAAAHWPGVAGAVDEDIVARDLAGLTALGKPAAAAPVQPAAAPGAHRPVKWLIARTMMLRRDPHHDDIYDPAQLVHKGAVLDQVGPEVGGWIEVTAGARRGWILKSNCTRVP